MKHFRFARFRSNSPKKCPKKIPETQNAVQSGRNWKQEKEDSRPVQKSAPMRIMTTDKMTEKY